MFIHSLASLLSAAFQAWVGRGGLTDGKWRQVWAGSWDQQRMAKGPLPRAGDGREQFPFLDLKE